MIVYVDMEHDRLRSDSTLWQHFSTNTLETKYRLEMISGEPCLIVRYQRLSPTLLRELKIGSVVLGGQYTALPHYDEGDLVGLRSVIREAAWPIIGLCGGMHLIAQTYGADFGPMDGQSFDAEAAFPETPTPPGVAALASETPSQTVRQERGFMPVQVKQPHPLFDGLGPEPVFFQLHSWEVKSLPNEFHLLAESPLCKVQVIAHQEMPLCGVQFHPERYDGAHLDGRRILENFFKLARV